MAMGQGMFDDQLKELMDLLEQLPEEEGAEQELPRKKSKEALIKELMEEESDEVLEGDQAAMVEYSMMMKQWEAMVKDYERREAEEAAEAAAQKAKEGSDASDAG